MIEDILTGLNGEQRESVLATEGAVRVVAGAGPSLPRKNSMSPYSIRSSCYFFRNIMYLHFSENIYVPLYHPEFAAHIQARLYLYAKCLKDCRHILIIRVAKHIPVIRQANHSPTGKRPS